MSIKRLDATPYLLEKSELYEDGKSVGERLDELYGNMVYEESVWLRGLEIRGCEVFGLADFIPELTRTRRYVIAVPQGIDPSRNIEEFERSLGEYRSFLKEVAEKQGKMESIGNRSTSLPHWIDGTELCETPAPCFASKITYRAQRAYRGDKATPREAVQLVKDSISRLKTARANAIKYRKRSEIPSLERRLVGAKDRLANIRSFLRKTKADNMLVRIKSGLNIKVIAKGRGDEGKFAYGSTVANSILVPVEAGFTFEPASTRKPKFQYEVLYEDDQFEFCVPITNIEAN